LNLSNILGLSLINVFLAGNTPFSPNRPRKLIVINKKINRLYILYIVTIKPITTNNEI